VRYAPVTCAQIALFRFIQSRPTLLALLRCHRSEVQARCRIAEVSCRPSDFKMVHSQVRLLRLVEFCANLRRISFQIELQVGLRGVLVLNFVGVAWLVGTHVKVVRLDGRNEVFIGRNYRRIRVLVRVRALVRCHESVRVVPFAQVYRRDLGLHLPDLLLLVPVRVRVSCRRAIRGSVLLVTVTSRADVKIGSLVLQSRIELVLTAAQFVSVAHLLILHL